VSHISILAEECEIAETKNLATPVIVDSLAWLAVPSNKRASEVEQYGEKAEASNMLEVGGDDEGWVAPPMQVHCDFHLPPPQHCFAGVQLPCRYTEDVMCCLPSITAHNCRIL